MGRCQKVHFLTLVDEPTDKPNEIAINYNGVRWTATSMIQYAFNDYFSSYRKKVSDSEMNDIRDSIAKSLAPVLPEKNAGVSMKGW